MNCEEADNVCKYLKSREIHLLPSNAWLIDCIKWFRTHSELSTIYGSLQEYVCIQWLLADLREVQHRCLPANCKNTNTKLTGKYSIQMNWIRDIGQSCYSQLRAAQNICESESNDNVTADEPMKQKWMPNSKRVLMMEVTDGITTLKAIEYSRIENLSDSFIPGLKAVLKGPIECRKGILFLTNINISLLGGEVERFYDSNSKINLLSKCLNLTSNNVRQSNSTNGTIINSIPAQTAIQVNRVPTFDDVQTFRNNISSTDRGGGDMIMSDIDDDVLCQLPDEALEQTDNYSPIRMSPVLDEWPSFNNSRSLSHADTNSKSAPQKYSLSHKKPLGINKPKLFPSLEDLTSIGGTSYSAHTVHSISENGSPHSNLNQSAVTSASYSNANCASIDLPISSTAMRQNRVEPKEESLNGFCPANFSMFLNRSSEKLGLEDSKSSVIEKNDGVVVIDEETWPRTETVQVTVQSITKLKIRNGEWYCCAAVLFDGNSADVTFSDKVLEELFGIAASEVEVTRGEMLNNPSLKKKVNEILRAGQTKLKVLNCRMTLEYSSEDCNPHVIKIHVL